jgi:hypothetical protein
MFTSTRGGVLLSSFSTTSFSLEPSGVSINELNQKMYISDDSQDRIFEIDRGPDGFFGTADDIHTFINTREYNIFDPEGVAVGGGYMYIADGINGEIYVISPGPNGVFDGYTSGDDIILYQFDTAIMGLSDVEGIDYNSDTGTLYMVGPFSSKKLIETTISGTLLQIVDIELLNAVKPSGISYAPSSYNTSIKSLYITQRGVDNDVDPLENDGKIFEILLSGPRPGPTETPTPTATFTPTNTPTATNTATATATNTATATATNTATATATDPATATATDPATATATDPATATATDTPTATATSTQPISLPYTVYIPLVIKNSTTLESNTSAMNENIVHKVPVTADLTMLFNQPDPGMNGFVAPVSQDNLWATLANSFSRPLISLFNGGENE